MSGTMKSQSPQNSPAPKSSTRGVMNCKPCQIRKIKCDRALPACGVCQLYQRSCFYEGVPKKRGPKKESLSALIKRIDGLEELLKAEKTPTPPGSDVINTDVNGFHSYNNASFDTCGSASSEVSPCSPFHEGVFRTNSDFPSVINAEGLVDIYFTYFHRNPYEILDEEATKQKLKDNQLPKPVLYALCAVATRYSEQPGKGPSSHVSAETYASWAQKEMENASVSLDSCQALLLLVTAFAAMGNGSRAYNVLSQAVGTVMALELYQCSEENEDHSPPENKLRKRLFWTCYIMNVFVATWLERPSLIDDAIVKATIPFSNQQSQSISAHYRSHDARCIRPPTQDPT
ncbi:TY1 enhancer activator [Colletotrichum higginsianum]|uniref:TY1 enhancer activator n=1 Tax=Colletotrichum higginsianum TaxID=80884 RepID=A0A4T0VCN0_9PEZI|nr:TY1 enhancer activator [Colletotrichum higginsianum]